MVSRSIVHGGSKKKQWGFGNQKLPPYETPPTSTMVDDPGKFYRGLKCWKEIGDIGYMIYINIYIYTLWLFNITMGKSPF